MRITLENTVRRIAIDSPACIPVLESWGIDYCCGGQKSLKQACQDRHLPEMEIMEQLEKAASETTHDPVNNWDGRSLADLARHIVSRHHIYVRQQLVRLEHLGEKVRRKHAQAHPEIGKLFELLLTVRDELSMHMMKEEQILFPYIARLEHAFQAKHGIPEPAFGTVANPIRQMMNEHDDAGSLMTAIRKISNGYTAPADACASYSAFYAALKEFELDLHQHIHLENNILFPRSVRMEEEFQATL
jgi:regulator of cell morphogenesis and NO signaling